MNDNMKLWCFLLLIPFFCALSYDLYTNFYKNPENLARLESLQFEALITEPDAYQASDFGYLLVNHTPGLYENIRGLVQEATWRKWVDPILQLYTTAVFAAPSILFFLWFGISKLFANWPFVSQGVKARNTNGKTSDNGNSLKKRDTANKFQYKRK